MQDRELYRQILGIEAPWWLRAASQKAVGEQLGLSWDGIHGIMERGWVLYVAEDRTRASLDGFDTL